MTITAGNPAPDLTIGSTGGDVQLSALWQEQPVLLVFLRHNG